MRIRTREGQPGYLGYCANVHPGESLADVISAVTGCARRVREQLGRPELALGLWLSRASLTELEEPSRLAELRAALAASGLFVCTLNGFPYGNFHAEVVKRRVYQPDLASPERGTYLLGLARVLAELLPSDAAEGTISTLPIGHQAQIARDTVTSAARALCHLSEELARLADRTGKRVRICIEPEPGCVLESTRDAVRFFTDVLPAAARSTGTRPELLAAHLGVCYDTCHQAVAFESATESFALLRDAGVTIGKAQLSSALEVLEPTLADARAELARFDEPRFLHQARALKADGTLTMVDDLSEVSVLPSDRPWRVHFHVPIHRALIGHITTTRPFLEAALAELGALRPVPHLEVETYTWSVLPEAERPVDEESLARGLADELRWVIESQRFELSPP